MRAFARMPMTKSAENGLFLGANVREAVADTSARLGRLLRVFQSGPDRRALSPNRLAPDETARVT